MPTADRPDPLKMLPIITGALLAGSVIILAVCAFVQRSRGSFEGPEIVAVLASAWAVSTPLLAGWLGSRAPTRSIGVPLTDSDKQKLVQLTILRFVMLEGGVLVCAVALVVQPTQWPLLAAMVPLSAMVLSMPRAR
jgi:hypothetical protein